MIQKILGVVGGVVVVFAAVTAGQYLLHAVVPMPAVDMTDAEAVKTLMTNAPMTAKLGLAAVYLVAAFLGAFVAAKVAGRAWAGWAVTGVMILATVANFVALPHPAWLMALALALIAGGGWFGARLGAGRT